MGTIYNSLQFIPNYGEKLLRGFFDFGTKISTLEGLDKVATFAKPLIAFISLQRYGVKISFRIVEDFDGLKSVKNSFSFFKQGNDLFVKSLKQGQKEFWDYLFELNKRMMGILMAVLNLAELVSKNVSKCVDYVTPPIKTWSFCIGTVVEHAIPVKLVVATFMVLEDLREKFNNIRKNDIKATYNQKKIAYFNGEYGKTNLAEGSSKYNAKVKAAIERKYGEKLDKLLVELDTVLAPLDKKDPEREFIQEIRGASYSCAKKVTILKALKKGHELVYHSAELEEGRKHLNSANVLMKMDNEKFAEEKILNINVSQLNITSENKEHWINVAVGIVKLASFGILMCNIHYGAAHFAIKLGVTTLQGAKIVEGISAFAGILDFAKFGRDFYILTSSKKKSLLPV